MALNPISKVPTGSGVKDNNKKTDLLYNEYIVYGVAQVLIEYLLSQGSKSWLFCFTQVQAKYLLQMKFNYKT